LKELRTIVVGYGRLDFWTKRFPPAAVTKRGTEKSGVVAAQGLAKKWASDKNLKTDALNTGTEAGKSREPIGRRPRGKKPGR